MTLISHSKAILQGISSSYQAPLPTIPESKNLPAKRATTAEAKASLAPAILGGPGALKAEHRTGSLSGLYPGISQPHVARAGEQSRAARREKVRTSWPVKSFGEVMCGRISSA